MQKAAVHFIMPVHLSLFMYCLGSQWTAFREIWYSRVSHTAAHVVLFPLLLRVPWYKAPWPTSTQGFSDPIRLFRRGGERAESKFSYTVAVIFVSSQVPITEQSSSTLKHSALKIHRRGQEHPSGYHLRNQHDSDEARKPGDHGHWSKAFELRRSKQCGRTRGRRVSVKYALRVTMLRMSRGNEMREHVKLLNISSSKICTRHSRAVWKALSNYYTVWAYEL